MVTLHRPNPRTGNFSKRARCQRWPEQKPALMGTGQAAAAAFGKEGGEDERAYAHCRVQTHRSRWGEGADGGGAAARRAKARPRQDARMTLEFWAAMVCSNWADL
jgi:hypothetical protein